MRTVFKVLLSTLVLLAQAGICQQTPAIQPPTNDELMMARELVRIMYPSLKMKDLHVTYTLTGDHLDLARPSYELHFLVQKFCMPPANANIAMVGEMLRPCGDYDKTYQDPLRGDVSFVRKHGALVLLRATFAGSLVRVPEKGQSTIGGLCTERTGITKEELIQHLPRKALEPLLGGIVSVAGVDPQDPYGADYGEWTVRLAATNRNVRQHYALTFDSCGTLHSLSNTD
jgi:hypothetical protein